MTQSQWNLPTNVTPIATIEATVQEFLNVLQMTRCTKFNRWQSNTTAIAWRWADTINTLRDSIDSVQLEIVVGKMQKMNIDFIDTNLRIVILDPYTILLKSILSSPLLPVCNNRVAILKTCYQESVKRIGQDKSKEIFRKIFSDGTNLLFNPEKITLQSSVLNSNLSRNCDYNHISGALSDDIHLATQLITSLCRHRKISDDYLIPTIIIDKLRSVVNDDSKSLRLLCIGITLPPITLYCASSNTFEANLTPISPFPSGTSSPAQIIDSTPTIEMYDQMNNNEQLWQIIVDNSKKDISRFLCFDSNFTIFQQLLTQNNVFTKSCVISLITAVNAKLFEFQNELKVGEDPFLQLYGRSIEVLLYIEAVERGSSEYENLQDLLESIKTSIKNVCRKRKIV